ncbi:MAG: ABC transporter permease [Chloroherpetonaceae bacterium]|nr:ABC transporter permease [Chloroherpetonaceae bacterium]MCS7210738.1 ABC transporter permease [Chloroherpetonaceae bacterium]MDW8019369.1 ABC transporter permease [Chloroherpetonaceae bacterium]
MSKIGVIIRKEYLERVRSKGFILATVLIPVLMSSFIVVPLVLRLLSDKSGTHLILLDKTGRLEQPLRQILEQEKSMRITVARAADEKEIYLREQELASKEAPPSGILTLQIDSSGKVLATYRGKSVTDFDLMERLENSVKMAVRRLSLKEKGFSDDEIARLEQPVIFRAQRSSEKSEDSGIGSFLVSYIMSLLIYATLLGYGAVISSAVIDEKASKVMEVLISSVKPIDLMIGKIVGVGLVALTQYSIWIVVALALSGLSLRLGASAAPPINFTLSPELLLYFVLYFVLGYLIYATLYAATGSAFESTQDAQALQTPITLLAIIPMLVIQSVISKPDSATAVILSLIPFFAPILMIARLSVTDVPLWQVLLSFVLMGATFYAAVWIAAKIYRVGVLMYGKKPSLNEIAKWLRYS